MIGKETDTIGNQRKDRNRSDGKHCWDQQEYSEVFEISEETLHSNSCDKLSVNNDLK